MMRSSAILAITAVLALEDGCLQEPFRARDRGPTAYVVDSLHRVMIAEPPPDQPQHAVTLYAAKGEFETFQIVINGGATGLDEVDLALTAPLTAPGGKALPSKAVAFYREHYVTVSKPSKGGIGGARLGSYPDALIPFRNPFTGERLAGGTYVPAPFKVDVGQNQVIQVEIGVSESAPADLYTASVSITSSKGLFANIPITLTVWDFTISKQPSLRSAFHDYDSDHLRGPARYYGYREGSPEHLSVAVAMDEILLTHRLVPETPFYSYFKLDRDGHIVHSEEQNKRLIELLKRPERSDFKLLFTEHAPFNDPLGADYVKTITYLREAYQWFDRRGLIDKVWLRTHDEPENAPEFQKTRSFADLIHEANPNLKVAITGGFDHQGFDQFLFGHLDTFMMGFDAFDPVKAWNQQSHGEAFWTYTAVVQTPSNPSPYWQIEFPLLNFRIIPWINFRYNLRGLLYWTTAYWNEIRSRGQSPWVDPCSLTEGGNCYNGDGMLVYPGKEVNYVIPAGAYGELSQKPVYGPIPSLRLKALRDGMEDYEMLTLAAQRDPNAAVDAAISVGCRGKAALGDARKNCFHSWNTDPDALLKMRVRLAGIILNQERRTRDEMHPPGTRAVVLPSRE